MTQTIHCGTYKRVEDGEILEGPLVKYEEHRCPNFNPSGLYNELGQAKMDLAAERLRIKTLEAALNYYAARTGGDKARAALANPEWNIQHD
jgi:hypothetical protein